MNKSVVVKICVCTIFIIILSNTFCLPASHAIGDVFSEGKGFLDKGNKIDKTIDTGKLKDTSDYIYNMLLGVAVMVAVVIAMVIGIQFMVASADEKAKVKESLLPFLVGCIVVFGAFTIWKIAVNIGNTAENQVSSSSGSSSPGGSTTHESSSGTIHGGGSTTHESSSGTIHGGGGSTW